MKIVKFLLFITTFVFSISKGFGYDMELDGLRYDYKNYNVGYLPGYGELHLVGYSSELSKNLIVPNEVQYKKGLTSRRCIVNTIASGAFKGCSILESIDNLSYVRYIEGSAFAYCSSLQSVKLGNVYSIGSKAFNGCTALNTIYIGSRIPSVQDDSFDENTYRNATLIVSAEFEEECKNHKVWSRFEKIISRYTVSLSISGNITGNSSVSINGELVKDATSVKTINEGDSVTLSFSAIEEGHELSALIVDGVDVTSQVVNNQYTIENVSKSMSIRVSFFSIQLTVSGNGHVLCNTVNPYSLNVLNTYGDTRNESVKYIVPDNEYLSFSLYPDNAYQIAKVTCNGEDITYRIQPDWPIYSYDFKRNTAMNVTFEKIPPTMYSFTIKSIGNGVVSYQDINISNDERTFSVEEGSSFYVSFLPDAGYRVKSVKLEGKDVTKDIVNGQLFIQRISANMSLEVEYEAIIHTLSLKVVGNGMINFNGASVYNESCTFDVTEGSSVILTFIADDGWSVKNVKVDGIDVTANVIEGKYTICNIKADTSVEVVFEPTPYYLLNIVAVGNGNVGYGSIVIRNQSQSYTLKKNSTTVLSLSPDAGYRLASVKLNGADAMGQVVDGQLTINSISVNTTVEVSFEIIPPTTYSLTVNSEGNGVVAYDGVPVRNDRHTFTVVEGTNVTLNIIADDDSRLKTLMVDGVDVTSKVTDNKYVINSVKTNTTVEALYEKIPTYTLSIISLGNGCALYDGIEIRNRTNKSSILEGMSVTISLTADAGYRIKSVKLNNEDVTANVKDNRYTINSISGDTSLEVEFEAIPYTLTIKSTGNGEASYNGTAIRGKSSTFTVTYGSSASVTFTPDAGYRIKSVKLNNIGVTANVKDNRYTISSISGDASLEVEFEAIPYTLTIKSTGNGEASYNGTAIRGKSSTFTITYGSSATISFTPDAGYRIKSVKLNNEDITANVTDSQYTIGNIMANMVVEVLFETIPDYILNIVATGNGNVGYEGIVIRNQSHSYTLREGSSAVLFLSPDAGYRLASVKVNGTEAMGQVTSGKLIIGNITVNTTVEVVFEIIPPTTYMLVVRAEGNGMVAFDGVFVRNSSQTFTVVEGEYATLEISADENNRLKRVSVDGIDVTPNVMNGKYIINDIKANTAVEVLFEEIPIYTLSVTAKGNGVATCNGTEIRNKTNTFSLYEGTSVTVSFTADTGYRVKSVKLNGADVTAAISDGQYTINGITADTTIEVEFERITYALTIEVVGNGSVVFDGVAIRGASKTFYVEEGNTATFTYAADDGFRLKGISMDGSTSVIDSGQYAIENITKNTTVRVEFEAIPTYALNIVAAGYGNVNYDNTVIRNQSQSYSVREGSTVVLTCEPDAGYRLASVKVNDTDVMGEIADGKLTIGNIAANTTVNVVFEAIPPTTYSLTITAAGNGSASYDGGTVRDGSKTFTVVEGAYATVVFTPDDGYHVKSVIVNGVDVSSNVFDNRYTVSKITANSTLEVDFEEDVKELTKDGLRYAVVSYADQTVNLASGEYGTVLTVPATLTANGKEWKVVGVEADALKDNQELAAIIWNPGAAFNGSVGNPNLLLYVKQKEFASPTVQNVIVDGVAENIVLTDAAIGNNFYCPKAFMAKQISYEHNYSMKSGYNTCEGWETLVLPFDVTKITRQSVTELVPHSVWTVGSSQRPFWLYSLTEIGWRPETAIAANTPYIISMPNNENYAQDYNLSGYIQFVGVDVQVKTSDNLPVGKNGQKRMVPNYQYRPTDSNVYALNVDNMYSQNASGSYLPGSTFVSGSRAVHPFEAYLTLEGANARNAIPLFEHGTTGINTLLLSEGMTGDDVYNLNGQRISIPRKGLYIVKGMKVVVK